MKHLSRLLLVLLPGAVLSSCSFATPTNAPAPGDSREAAQKLYQRGLASFKDLRDEGSLKKGFDLFQEAVREGDQDALNAVGVAKIFGFGTEMNPTEGLRTVVRAAEGGSSKAWYNLSSLVLYRIAIKEEPQRALTYIERAALKGDVESQYQFGIDLLDPKIEYDPDLAVRWFQKAANANDETAAAFVGGLHVMKKIKEPNPELGFRLLKQLSTVGNPTAKYWLGEYYAQLESDHADAIFALDYLIQAHEAGVRPQPMAKAITLIQEIARSKLDEEPRKKIVGYLEAKQTNSCLANALLGGWYTIEGSRYLDYPKGRLVLEAGANRRCDLSIESLGDMYRLGRGVTNDLVKAGNYYTSIVDTSADAAVKAAALLFGGVTDKQHPAVKTAYEAAFAAARMDNAKAFELLAAILASGGSGQEKSDVKAYAWALLAAERDPAFNRLAEYESRLTPEQRLEGVQQSQFFKIMIRRHALEAGEKSFRF